jgi:thiol:disulfide interchange protein
VIYRRIVLSLLLLALGCESTHSPGEIEAGQPTQGASPAPHGKAAERFVENDEVQWVKFHPAVLQTYLDAGRPVFVNYTADWCLGGKSNEKILLEDSAFRDKLVSTGVVPMKADFTDEDPVIERWIAKTGRAGIPLYVVYLPDGSDDILPEVTNTDRLMAALDRAADSSP